ncbi:MAG TPA: ankyrin repeat domain-containing protein [Vicinamibacterales bacterium]|jgi:ankyrin repeat protein|nr:ankyrin repeat domain-containing protein [Vicinamibacterales bacterium]
MAASSDRSRFLETLPSHPDLEFQRKRAKELLRAAWRGDGEAVARVAALHPHPPKPEDLKLADAQLVLARGYGFESWAALTRKIASLTGTPVDAFLSALNEGDVERVRALLRDHADVRAAINAPISHFNSRPVARATKNLPMLDLLLEYGADLNQKSEWWAGGFGLLEYGCTPSDAAALMARGAAPDVFAAAHLGMFDRVRALVDAQPSLVLAKGGDGKTPLHCATTVEIAAYLLDRGAEIDARDVDHESTPLQYLVKDAPEVARLLVDRGAWFDIFIASWLRDRALIARCLREDPEALDHRTGRGRYRVAHNGKAPSTPEQRAGLRGDIYRWVFEHNVSALDVVIARGDTETRDLLLGAATPVQQLLAASAAADRATALAVVAADPGAVSRMTASQRAVISDRAMANDTRAVLLMLELGFDPLATPDPGGWEAVRWAAYHGNVEMMRPLLARQPPINVPDPAYNGTMLGNCLHGAIHGWRRRSGDYPETVRLLLAAGERLDPEWVPIGRDDVDAVLRDALMKQRGRLES